MGVQVNVGDHIVWIGGHHWPRPQPECDLRGLHWPHAGGGIEIESSPALLEMRRGRVMTTRKKKPAGRTAG
ncbi:hypothetical protein ACFPLB_00185 [Aquamicrobium segne]|uniref:Uncharacterized protein n=1 Tax=Aquamicrobium segne TaxID=469547 RepID=A0ABW0GV70_9HYPH